MGESRLPDDWFHRHPHLTTLLASCAGALFVVGAIALAEGSPTLMAVGFASAVATFTAVGEGMSLLLRLPVVPYLLTGEGLGDYRYVIGDPGHVPAGSPVDCGGGGGDGGGGG